MDITLSFNKNLNALTVFLRPASLRLNVAIAMVFKAFLLLLLSSLLTQAIYGKQVCGRAAEVDNRHNGTCAVTAQPTAFQPLDFSISKWIWTGENPVPRGNNPVGTRAFRKTIRGQCDKCAICATILIVCDDAYKLYVNGKLLGTGNQYTASQVWYTAFHPKDNVIAVAGTNAAAVAGLMATISVHYSDGTTETVITDESWRTFIGDPPANFEQPSFDDSKWKFAANQGGNGAPWPTISIPVALPLANSRWIWTGETGTDSTAAAPIGSRAFRKTVETPGCTKRAVCATVAIDADNDYVLYHNGQKVGSDTDFTKAEVYSIPNLDPYYNVFAVNATNDQTAGPAGLIATILITYDDGSSEVIVTDKTWKTMRSLPVGFELMRTDDITWPNATEVGAYGVPPWGAVPIPQA